MRNNHEIWVVCPQCGCEYDARIWGDTCPNCASKIINEIKKYRNGKRHHQSFAATL